MFSFHGLIRTKVVPFVLSLDAVFLFLSLFLATPIHAGQVTLAWNANPDQSIAGYRVYYGTSSRNYPYQIDVGNQTTYTVPNLQNVTYYFAVTDYNTRGTESIYSAEVVYNPPAPSCTFSLSAPSRSFSASAGTGAVNVTTTAGCAWTVVNNAPSWITLTSNSSVTGNGTVNYAVAANTGSGSRTGTLAIAGQTFTVTQSGVACTYSISSSSQSIGSSGGTGSLSVTAAGGCSWTASSNASWITINPGSGSGNGNGTFSYSVAANTSTSSRTGTLSIAGQTFTVSQSSADACSYSISPTNQSFGSRGGTGKVGITAPGGCSWSASSSVQWIRITSGGNGSGNGSITYSVSGNYSRTTRKGTLTIGGQTFTVTQSRRP